MRKCTDLPQRVIFDFATSRHKLALSTTDVHRSKVRKVILTSVRNYTKVCEPYRNECLLRILTRYVFPLPPSVKKVCCCTKKEQYCDWNFSLFPFLGLDRRVSICKLCCKSLKYSSKEPSKLTYSYIETL